MTRDLGVAGTAMVPSVPVGVWTCRVNRCRADDQRAAMSPYLVGTTPWAQSRLPGWGLMLQVAYPGPTADTPSTCSVSCTVGDAAQPCARLAVARFTPPVAFLNSQSPPV